MSKLQLIATCPMGLESVVARELKDLGYEELTVENGRVLFKGNEKDICRTNLWLRTSDRILIKMGEFKAITFDQLFEGTKALAWSEWISENAEFPVEGKSYKSQLSSVPASQGIVKKAIVEKMKQQYNVEWFNEEGPRYVIEISLLNDIATLTIDTTGPSLHKRGYRKLVTEAPLKETMAAAMVLLSRWRPDRPLYDPFCGSGTIPIEAAMIAWNMAPGLKRSFPSEAWPRIPESMWLEAKEEAYDSLRDDVPFEIMGSDIDPLAIEIAQASAKSAGLSKEISFNIAPVAKLNMDGEYGCIITNPPYGERLGNEREVASVIRELGSVHKKLETWSSFVLNPLNNFEHVYGKKASKKRKLYNGRIECHLFQYFGTLPPRNR